MLKRAQYDNGFSVLLVEHDLDFVVDMCQEIYVLDYGRLIGSGAPDDVLNLTEVRRAYLGQVPEIES